MSGVGHPPGTTPVSTLNRQRYVFNRFSWLAISRSLASTSSTVCATAEGPEAPTSIVATTAAAKDKQAAIRKCRCGAIAGNVGDQSDIAQRNPAAEACAAAISAVSRCCSQDGSMTARLRISSGIGRYSSSVAGVPVVLTVNLYSFCHS